MRFFKDIFHLFFPKICINCSEPLLESEKILCTSCFYQLPVIEDNEFVNSKLMSIFYGKVPVKEIQSFFYYQKSNIVQKLIHALKYKGQEEIGVFIGNWFGYELMKRKVFDKVDCIIPVPLHESKLKKRGYNQLTEFGKTLSKLLNIDFKPAVLICVSKFKTQTFKQRFERFSNNETKFHLNNLSAFENKHVLLIDDVVTTGATLEACCKELLKVKNITISICTIAYTEKV